MADNDELRDPDDATESHPEHEGLRSQALDGWHCYYCDAEAVEPIADDAPEAIWRAWYDSRSFSFEAYGFSEAEARDALRAGLDQHARDYSHRGVAADWYDADDIIAAEYRIGAAYRDGEAVQP
jgi:hypothetical protein